VTELAPDSLRVLANSWHGLTPARHARGVRITRNGSRSPCQTNQAPPISATAATAKRRRERSTDTAGKIAVHCTVDLRRCRIRPKRLDLHVDWKAYDPGISTSYQIAEVAIRNTRRPMSRIALVVPLYNDQIAQLALMTPPGLKRIRTFAPGVPTAAAMEAEPAHVAVDA
jgi:hypothetical protein